MCTGLSPVLGIRCVGGGPLIRLGIVDDHPVFRLGLIRLFEREPDLKTVWELGSLEKLEEVIDQHPVDVVLMDLNLGPEQDALAATRSIREKHDAVKVIIVSGSLDFEWAAASRAAGANGYLPKDLPVADMMAAIRGLASPNFGRSSFSDLLNNGPKRNGIPPPTVTLTRRERQVLTELRRGKANKEIAIRLGVSVSTINKHVQSVLKKLHVRTRAQAVVAMDAHSTRRPYLVSDQRHN
jgi:DNA-binding NarL/FixJ family response regulator